MKYLKEALKDSESLNVLDDTGEFARTDAGSILTVARGAAHKYGVFHQTSNLLAAFPGVKGPQVVLQKRAASKDIFPGVYTLSVGGHMGTDVDPRLSVAREASEELGLTIDPARLLNLGDSQKGLRNYLRIWQYLGTPLLQMGDEGKLIAAPPDVPREIIGFVRSVSNATIPPRDTMPKGLFLDVLNREYCFFFLCVLLEDEICGIKFSDGEAAGITFQPLDDFFATPDSDKTDLTHTLLANVSDLKQTVEIACGGDL